MQDEATTSQREEQPRSGNQIENGPGATVPHLYYEVGKELLSKPNALCDLLELEGLPPTIIYCNTPSDADFVDVMLRKRGVGSQKLIGYVPQPKLAKALEDFNNGQISVLVATDIGARGVDQSKVELVVSYSVPSDLELYSERACLKKSEGANGEPVKAPQNLRKVLSLIGPLDLSNFHYLKKVVSCEFHKGELPSPEQLFKGKFEGLKRSALTGAEERAKYKELASLILKDGEKEAIVELLLHNTLEVVPSLKAATSRSEDLEDSDFEDDSYEQPRYNDRGGNSQRGGRDSRGGGRDSRGGGRGRDRDGGQGRGNYGRDNRDDDRQPRFNSRDDQRFGNEGDDDSFNEVNGNRDPGYRDSYRGDSQRGGGRRQDRGDRNGRGYDRGDRGDRGERGNRGDRGERGEQRQNRQSAPPVKTVRAYIGRGASHGFSQDAFADMLKEKCDLPADTIKRFSRRENYTFVDIPEEVSADVIEKLGATTTEGTPFVVQKAITISAPREEQEGQEPRQRDDQREGDDAGGEGNENGDHGGEDFDMDDNAGM